MTGAIYGDQGAAPLGLPVMDRMILDHYYNPFDLMIHVGDIAYAGTGKEVEFEYLWDVYGRMLEPLAANVPYMTSVGNHEKYYNFTAYQNRFYMPGDRSDPKLPYEGGNFYFSFEYGNVKFVSMCTETYAADYKQGTKQYQWLEQQFATVDRKKTPFVILLGHRPMYSSDVETDSGPLQERIEPLMAKYGVDVGVWGHMHVYERTHPVINNTADVVPGNVVRNAKKPIHLVIGTAGALGSDKFQDPPPTWSAARSKSYGYVRWTMVNQTTLHFQFLNLFETVEDEIWLIKDQ
jgi:predicted phosphodiesterase